MLESSITQVISHCMNIKGNYPLKACSYPRFHCWDNPPPVGKHYTFGWLTGIDNDLICVFPNVKTRVLGHWTLSPVHPNRLVSFIAFTEKRFLFLVDHNLEGLIVLLYGMDSSKGFRNRKQYLDVSRLYYALPSHKSYSYHLGNFFVRLCYIYLYVHALLACIHISPQPFSMLAQLYGQKI